MMLKTTALVLLCVSLISQPVFADDMAEMRAQLKAMQKQMQIMQAKLDAQSTSLAKQQVKQEKITTQIKHQQAIREKDKDARAVSHQIADSLSIGGVIEIDAGHRSSSDWSGDSADDIILDTFELVIEANASEWVSGSMLFLYEDEKDDEINIDEAYITIANSEVTPFYAAAGRLYVPFGDFETNMVSDPATLTLAETREDVIQFGFEMDNGFYGSAYVFNGDAEQAKSDFSSTDSNKIDNYGLSAGYAMENDRFSLDIGAGYINNIATSKTLQDQVGDNGLCAGDGCVKDYVAGLSLHATANIGAFTLIAEYITALDDFEANELGSVNTDKLKPEAWNIEAAYNFTIAGRDAVVALGYQDTDDMYFDTENTDVFDKAWLASISVAIFENTSLSAEWRHASIYSEVKDARTAAGEQSADDDLVRVKLSYEF